MPIQQMLLGGGAAVATKTYVDDVFSTYVYKGNGSTQTLNTGVDLTEGGLIWLKCRNQSSQGQYLMDSARNSFGNRISSSDNTAQTTDALITATSSTGFTLGSKPYSNNSGDTYASWSFRKAPGFFDVVTWSGDSATSRTISHNLGCIPGMIVIKKTVGTTSDWVVYHRSVGNTKALYLNATNYAYTGTYWFNDTSPTADEFTIGNIHLVNGSGNTYVAYLFAGGSATRQYSVKTTSGNSNYLSVPTHADLNLDGDFTVEFWHKRTTTGTTHLFSYGNAATNAGIEWYYNGSNVQKIYINATEYEFPNGTQSPAYKWVHYAISRQGTNTRVFIDGRLMTTYTSHSSTITGSIITGNQWDGSISASDGAYWSNLRVVKGTAVYTAAFTPPQSALTNITNTKLLCWNSSTTTGATVSPVTIAQNGTVTSKSDTPSYSDPNCFVFGEGGDKNIVATGSYEGNGSSTGPEINLGWEPQFLILKESSDSGQQWRMYDSMRGIVTGGNDAELYPSSNTSEDPDNEFLELTSTGFKLKTTDDAVNDDGQTYIFLAIRRPDGYCGKLPELGTDVFAMDTGNSSSTIPCFDSGFPVDFATFREPATTANWFTGGRLLGTKYLFADTNAAEANLNSQVWDSNTGFQSGQPSGYQAWMWKRHAGFDVVAYTGEGVAGKQIPHSLNKTVEMIWVKYRDDSKSWLTYHKGLNGGTNPQNYTLNLNSTAAESGSASWWNNTAPTSTTFTVGNSTKVNDNGGEYIAMLFASVDGISKVGSYTGSSGSVTLDLGFSPRFLIIKRRDGANSWMVFDTLRGIPAGNDPVLLLNANYAQDTSLDYLDVTSSGVTINNVGENSTNNGSSMNYIYYAHA